VTGPGPVAAHALASLVVAHLIPSPPCPRGGEGWGGGTSHGSNRVYGLQIRPATWVTHSFTGMGVGMPWTERTPMEERMALVRAWRARVFSIRELCAHFGVSRKTGYKWMDRYLEGRAEGLRDQSRAPHRCPHRTVEEVVEAVVAVRRANPR